MPNLRARSRPSDFGSMPTSAAISSTGELRRILIIKSVPILPEPIMATLSGRAAEIAMRLPRRFRPAYGQAMGFKIGAQDRSHRMRGAYSAAQEPLLIQS